MKNETVLFETVHPHHNPVPLADLLTDIEAVIKKHVILSDHAAAALAVWVLHTYTFELRDTVAYVAIESPEKRCGKTTLLSVLAAMACKPLIASNITVGALFRAIDTCRPTLFIDEADTFLAGNSAMRGIINSGNTRRTAYVLRLSATRNRKTATPPSLHESGVGQASRLPVRAASSCALECAPVHTPNVRPILEPETPQSSPAIKADGAAIHPGLIRYSCWCPKVIAMIGEVPDTIADRSIVVKMSRKLTTEACASLADLDTDEIKSKCVRFALDASPFIAAAEKTRIEGLNDRAADTLDPLYVIARLAGEAWEKKLLGAALTLSTTADVEKSGSGLILDIMDIIFDSGGDKIFTRDLVARLREGNMKSTALKYSSINEHQTSKILRPYGIKPVTMRIGAEVRNGYYGKDFREALGRYVTPADAEARVEAIKNRMKLRIEAQAEAEKTQAIVDKVMARAPKDRALTLSEAKAMFEEELKNTPSYEEMISQKIR